MFYGGVVCLAVVREFGVNVYVHDQQQDWGPDVTNWNGCFPVEGNLCWTRTIILKDQETRPKEQKITSRTDVQTYGSCTFLVVAFLTHRFLFRDSRERYVDEIMIIKSRVLSMFFLLIYAMNEHNWNYKS